MVPSPLYKYRSLDTWAHVEDIFKQSRLYASDFRSLNDPMEGLLYTHDTQVSEAYRRAVRTASGRLNICSLSASGDNTLLWSYYAGGHKGIAIGVRVVPRQSPRVDEPERVNYDMTVNIHPLTEQSDSPSAIAKRILTQKLTFWSHENEYRAFTTQRFVPVEILEVLLGCNATRADYAKLCELVAEHRPGVVVRQLKRTDLKWPGNQ
ncbi:MAG: DUF2971 domain-containing protein [Chloroflexota bacterium]